MEETEGGDTGTDWKCVRILGRGSFGVVGLWRNNMDGQLVAVKKFEVHQEASSSYLQELQSRYRKEVEMMYNQVNNPHIVSSLPPPKELIAQISKPGCTKNSQEFFELNYEQVGDSNSSEGINSLPLLCMEFCSGGDLRQMLRRPENISGLPECEVFAVLGNISDAISYLHENDIIHRDIKPENILIHLDGSSKATYKLSDLGFAKDVSGTGRDTCSTILGTLQYIAPEILAGKKYDKTVDYWSFGLIAFEIMCGIRPFLPGEPPAAWIPRIKEKAKDVIAIYRTDDGKIEFATDMPYNTRLSESLKKCLVAWLPSMLQLEPSRRGKYVQNSINLTSNSGESNALKRLRNMLNTKFLEIHTISGRFIYAVGRSVKLEELKSWIARDTKVKQEDQILLTADGKLVEQNYFDPPVVIKNCCFYLLSKTTEDCNSKMKLSKVLSSFLVKDHSLPTSTSKARSLRMVWISVISCIQNYLDLATCTIKSFEAIKLYHDANYSQLKRLRGEVENSCFALKKLVDLEREKQKMQEELNKQSSALDDAEYFSEIVRSSCESNPVDKLLFQPASLADLEEIHRKILENYMKWRSDEEQNKAFQTDVLVRLFCHFVKTQDSILKNIIGNIRTLVDRITNFQTTIENLSSNLFYVNEHIDNSMGRQLTNHKILVDCAGATAGVNSRSNSLKRNQNQKKKTDNQTCEAEETEKLQQRRESKSNRTTGGNRSLVSSDASRLIEEAKVAKSEVDAKIFMAVLAVEEVLGKQPK